MKKLIPYIILLISILFAHITNASPNKANASPFFPLKPGYINLAIPVKLDSLNPAQTHIAHAKYIIPLIYEPLVTINSENELLPVLAKKWVVSSDNNKIVISINPGHFFSDNTEVTSENVVQSFYYLCSKGSQEYTKLSGLQGCTEHANGATALPQVSAINKYDISFTINCSPSNFLYQLSLQSAVITKLINNHLIGSGTYKLERNSGNYVVLSQNPYYHGNYQAMNPGVIFFYAKEKYLANMIASGRADGIVIFRIKDVPPLLNNKYKLISSNSNITEILALNNTRYPFNHKIIRNALASDIYNNFNSSCLTGAQNAYGIIPTGIGGSITAKKPIALTTYSRDDVFRIIPSLRTKHISVLLHQLADLKSNCESAQIKTAFKKYNIDVSFKYHKDYSTLAPIVANHQIDGLIDLYVYTGTDAYSVLQKFSKSGENIANTNDKKIDNLLKEATMAQTSHLRYQTYNKLTTYIQDEGVVIPLYYMNHGTLLKKCLSGISDDFFFSPFTFIPRLSKNKSCTN